MRTLKILSYLLLSVFVFANTLEAKEKKYDNGDYYSGELKKGKPNGFGTMNYANGNKYIGFWSKGVNNGQGTMIFSDGSEYAGEWSEGKINGEGLFSDSINTIKFEGTFNLQDVNNEPASIKPLQGVLTMIGAKMDGSFDGNGVFTGTITNQYAYYTGVIADQMFTNGKMEYANGGVIEGTMLLTPQFEGAIDADLNYSYLIDSPAHYMGHRTKRCMRRSARFDGRVLLSIG